MSLETLGRAIIRVVEVKICLELVEDKNKTEVWTITIDSSYPCHLESMLKSRDIVDKGLSSQSYGFSSSHIWTLRVGP